MSLDTYLRKNSARPDLGGRVPIYYFSKTSSATQFKRLADAKHWVIVDARYVFEEAFLRKYSEQNATTTILACLDNTDDPLLFAPSPDAQDEGFARLCSEMQAHLISIGIDNVKVRLRQFVPEEIPAVVIISQTSDRQERLREALAAAAISAAAEGILSELASDEQRTPAYLNLNSANWLIRALRNIERHTDVGKAVMTGIYNSAVVNAQNLMSEQNTRAMHDQLVQTLGLLLTKEERLLETTRELEAERQQLLSMKQHHLAAKDSRPEHIRLFMITPFDASYGPLEEAIRALFEVHPYYFEVSLARDYTFGDSLLDNIREHFMRSHGFIAEVSELNPNVMFELGAVMLPADERPVFTIRSRLSTREVPSDLREKLRIEYGSLQDSMHQLTDELRNGIEKDGRIVHEQLRNLLAQRRRRFLSSKLLRTLHVRLQEAQLDSLLRQFRTVEEFLGAEPAEVQRLTGLQHFLAQALQGELREFVAETA